MLLVEDESALASGRDGRAGRRGISSPIGRRRRTGARARHAKRVRPGDLRPEDAEASTGSPFYKALADSTPALSKRVLFVTGDVAGTDAEQFLNESGCRWLAKPFRLGDLLRAVREELAVAGGGDGRRCRPTLSVARAMTFLPGLYASTTPRPPRRSPEPSPSRLLGRRIRRTPCASPRPAAAHLARAPSRRRRIARACSCETRDSLTPISAPICFIVTSP